MTHAARTRCASRAAVVPAIARALLLLVLLLVLLVASASSATATTAATGATTAAATTAAAATTTDGSATTGLQRRVLFGAAPGAATSALEAAMRSGVLACASGGGEVVGVDKDYCDCADGSDEPGTAACAAASGAAGFYCANAGHRSVTILPTRVGDGLCDCCDGSDEVRVPGELSTTTCANTCAEKAAAASVIIRATNARLVAGARKLREATAAAQADVRERRERLPKLKVELEVAAALEETLESRVASAESAERIERAAGASKQACSEPGGTCESVVPEVPDDSESDAESAYYEDLSWYEWLMTTPLRSALTSLWPEPEAGPLHTLRGELAIAQRERATLREQLERLEEVLAIDYGPNDRFFMLRDVCAQLETSEYTYDVCVFGVAMQKARVGRRDTRLGTWKRWISLADVPGGTQLAGPGASAMQFIDGEYCHGAGARSLIVALECGEDTVLQRLSEPSTCAYTAVMRTPAMCNDAHADVSDLDAPIAGVEYVLE